MRHLRTAYRYFAAFALAVFIACGEETLEPLEPADAATHDAALQCFRPGPCGRQCRVDCGCPGDTCDLSRIPCIQECQDQNCRGEEAEPWPCPDSGI